jgi:hypothetical protein
MNETAVSKALYVSRDFYVSDEWSLTYWLTDWLTDWLTYWLTYLLTPWSRVLLEKLTGFAASQKIPLIYGTRKFITVPTSARHLSLSWARSIQSPQPPPTSWRSIFMLVSHLRLGLPSGLFPSGFPTNTLYKHPFFPHTRYMPRPSHSSRYIWWAVQTIKLLIM